MFRPIGRLPNTGVTLSSGCGLITFYHDTNVSKHYATPEAEAPIARQEVDGKLQFAERILLRPTLILSSTRFDASGRGFVGKRRVFMISLLSEEFFLDFPCWKSHLDAPPAAISAGRTGVTAIVALPYRPERRLRKLAGRSGDHLPR